MEDNSVIKEPGHSDARVNQDFWSRFPCGKDFSGKPVFTKEFYDEVEEERYRRQPYLFSFAQFTRYHGKRVLEAGTGLGIDFSQWVRAGALAYGTDLTEEAVSSVRRLLELRGLKAEEVRTANAEALPYPDNFFDLVYSWGVIHHTPDMEKAVSEILRVITPGGHGKVMIYNRYSMVGFYIWIRHALLKGRPWKTLDWGFRRFIQNPGTQAYRPSEMKKMLEKYGACEIEIRTVLTFADKLERYKNRALTFTAGTIARILGGDRVGLYMLIDFKKKRPF